jgi:hypothetical protein
VWAVDVGNLATGRPFIVAGPSVNMSSTINLQMPRLLRGCANIETAQLYIPKRSTYQPSTNWGGHRFTTLLVSAGLAVKQSLDFSWTRAGTFPQVLSALLTRHCTRTRPLRSCNISCSEGNSHKLRTGKSYTTALRGKLRNSGNCSTLS